MTNNKPVKVGEHYFKYDYEDAIVHMMYKPSVSDLRDMKAENVEWQKQHGSNLWKIDEDGLCEIDTVGLSRENWNDPEARTEYLEMWNNDVAEETSYAVEEFNKYFYC